MAPVTPHKDKIALLCRENKVNELYVFGSAVTPYFRETSDIDLLVDFMELSPKEYTRHYFNLKFSLEEIFGRPVDLLEKEAIKNPYFIEVLDNQKILVYAARS